MSTRWTYQVLEIKMQLFGKSMTERAQEELTRAGQLGWELVSSVQSHAADSIRLFLKKPV
jgi:L-amino acid N-acyltransferase YncA